MNFKLKITAAAIAAMGCGAALAAPVVGAGASAVRNTAEGVIASYCTGATALTKYIGTNANVTRLVCATTQAITGLGTNFDFTYDSNGGSWRAFTVTNPTLNAEAVVQSVVLPCTGTATTTATIGTVTGVSVISGCVLTAAPTATAIGFTDVEPALYSSPANQPTGPNAGGTAVAWPTSFGATSYTGQILGVVFGVAASQKLYTELQADQITGGSLPSTCVVGASLADAVCAPSITRQQYRSVVQNASVAGGGALQFDDSYLFSVAANVTAHTGEALALARRDQGSGTQAGSNATFLGIGCAGSAAWADLTVAPAAAGATETVTINASTGGVTAQLGGVGVIGLGIVSRENAPTATVNAASGWGFLKLDGVYPDSKYATTGRYDYFTEETLYCKAGASTEEAKLCTDIQGSAATFVNTAGAFSLTALFAGYTGAAPSTGTFYRSNGNTCGKSFAQ